MSRDSWSTEDTLPSPARSAAIRVKGELPAGMVVGGCVIERLIGVGGCGLVYLARRLVSIQEVAIKVLHRELAAKPKMVERFVREVEVVNLLRHPNVVAIHELGTLEDGRPYCIMEYLSGTTLEARLRAEGRLMPEDALDILEPVCSALQAAHEAGIVHRDIKPSNIALSVEDDRAVIKLLDFGIAKLTDPELSWGFTSVGRCLGTVTVMAPEQIRCEPVDARTDVYALGVLLYQMLVGQAPFASRNAQEVLYQHLEAPPPRPSQRAPVSPALDAIVRKAMDKKPEQRFASAQAFLSAVREAVGKPEASDEASINPGASAVGIYVGLSIDAAGDVLDDALAEDAGRVLDLVEERVRLEGLTLILATGSAVIAALPLSPAWYVERRERQRVLAIAASLHRAIVARPGADERVGVAMCVHVQEAVVRSSAHQPQVLGGAVTQTSAWILPEGIRGLFVTNKAVEGLPGVDWSAAPVPSSVSGVTGPLSAPLTLRSVA